MLKDEKLLVTAILEYLQFPSARRNEEKAIKKPEIWLAGGLVHGGLHTYLKAMILFSKES